MSDNDDLTEIKVALARQETLIKAHLEQQALINTRLAARGERHSEFISDASIRMDRLEQSERRRAAISLSALTGVVLLALKSAWGTLFGGGTPPGH